MLKSKGRLEQVIKSSTSLRRELKARCLGPNDRNGGENIRLFCAYGMVLSVARSHLLALNDFEKLRAALEHIRPSCEACGYPAVVQYDSNGEGLYWLCARTDGDHDEAHYCGTEVYRLETFSAASEKDPAK